MLGAAVGALGTTGAGITVALINRSQTKLQLRAEHARIIREPRKATYVSHAEATGRLRRRLLDITVEINSFVTIEEFDNAPTEYVEERRADMQASLEQVQVLNDELAHSRSQIDIEGPSTVRDAASSLDEAVSKLYRDVTLMAANFCFQDNLPPLEKLEATFRASGDAAAMHYRFVSRCSTAIGHDGLSSRDG